VNLVDKVLEKKLKNLLTNLKLCGSEDSGAFKSKEGLTLLLFYFAPVFGRGASDRAGALLIISRKSHICQ
jgi:hypothetical protein